MKLLMLLTFIIGLVSCTPVPVTMVEKSVCEGKEVDLLDPNSDEMTFSVVSSLGKRESIPTFKKKQIKEGSFRIGNDESQRYRLNTCLVGDTKIIEILDLDELVGKPDYSMYTLFKLETVNDKTVMRPLYLDTEKLDELNVSYISMTFLSNLIEVKGDNLDSLIQNAALSEEKFQGVISEMEKEAASWDEEADYIDYFQID